MFEYPLYKSSAISIITFFNSKLSINFCGIWDKPKYAPIIFPVTEPVESLSPLWFTEVIIAFSKLSEYFNAQ